MRGTIFSVSLFALAVSAAAADKDKPTAIFTGKVIEATYQYTSIQIRIQVEKSWRGVKGETAEVVTAAPGESGDGYAFLVGEDYLVFAHGEAPMRVLGSGKTRKAKDVALAIKGLGEPVWDREKQPVGLPRLMMDGIRPKALLTGDGRTDVLFTTVQRPRWGGIEYTEGVIGKAMRFDGKKAFGLFEGTVLSRNRTWTVAGWIRPREPGVFYSEGHTNRSNVSIAIQKDGSLVVKPSPYSRNGLTGPSGFLEWKKWSFFAIAHDGVRLHFYANGVHIGKKDVPPGERQNFQSARTVVGDDYRDSVGRRLRPKPELGFAGDLDELTLFPRALTAKQANLLYQGGAYRLKGMPISPWPLKAEERKRLMKSLGSGNRPGRVHAIWRLAAAGPETVDPLRLIHKAAGRVDTEAVKAQIGRLSGANGETRDDAMARMIAMGGGIQPILREQLESEKLDAGIRSGLEVVLEAISGDESPMLLRSRDALESLQRNASDEARKALKDIE